METLLNKNLILTEDKFIWKILTPEEALNIYKKCIFSLYEVRKEKDTYVESLIESREKLDKCIMEGCFICIEVGFLKEE